MHRGTCLACHLQSKVADILTFLFDFEFVILYSAAEVTNGGSIGKLVQPVPENQKRLIFLRFCLCNSICVCICPCDCIAIVQERQEGVNSARGDLSGLLLPVTVSWAFVRS